MTQQNRETLLALADRAEKATAESFELFAEAFESIHGHDLSPLRGRVGDLLDAGAWLDAAMSLVPEGLAWTVGQNVHHRHWVASLNYLDEDGAPQSMAGSNAARSPALALCAAALRARATLDPTGKKA